MCSVSTDPFQPRDVRTADPARRADMEEWLADQALVVDSCGGCDEVEFVCSSQCAEAFRQSHLACTTDTERDDARALTPHLSLVGADVALRAAGDAVHEVTADLDEHDQAQRVARWCAEAEHARDAVADTDLDRGQG